LELGWAGLGRRTRPPSTGPRLRMPGPCSPSAYVRSRVLSPQSKASPQDSVERASLGGPRRRGRPNSCLPSSSAATAASSDGRDHGGSPRGECLGLVRGRQRGLSCLRRCRLRAGRASDPTRSGSRVAQPTRQGRHRRRSPARRRCVASSPRCASIAAPSSGYNFGHRP
jgi:hypothetical protein